MKKLKRKAALDDPNCGIDARWDTNFAQAERRSAAAKRRMDRLEREMAQSARVAKELAHGGVSLPIAAHRIDKNLAKTTRNLRRIDETLARMTKTLSKITGRRARTDAKLNASSTS